MYFSISTSVLKEKMKNCNFRSTRLLPVLLDECKHSFFVLYDTKINQYYNYRFLNSISNGNYECAYEEELCIFTFKYQPQQYRRFENYVHFENCERNVLTICGLNFAPLKVLN